jgi:hypothetical protein
MCAMLEIQNIEVLDNTGNVLAVVEGWIDVDDESDGNQWTGELYTNTAIAKRLRSAGTVTLRTADGRSGKFTLEPADTEDIIKVRSASKFG